MELITTEHHQAARSLYSNWGFEFLQVYTKNYLFWGIVSLNMYRLRVACLTIAKKLRSPQDQDQADITEADLLKVD